MELDYDHYDSSQAECIHNIMNGYVSEANGLIIATAYKFLSDEGLKACVEQALSQANMTARFCEVMLNTF
jgi:hypothetical protein